MTEETTDKKISDYCKRDVEMIKALRDRIALDNINENLRLIVFHLKYLVLFMGLTAIALAVLLSTYCLNHLLSYLSHIA